MKTPVTALLGGALGLVLACAGSQRTAASPEDQACVQAGDCVLTRLPLGGCCDTCEVRALNHDGNARERARCGHYANECPVNDCAPITEHADCIKGRCVAKR